MAVSAHLRESPFPCFWVDTWTIVQVQEKSSIPKSFAKSPMKSGISIVYFPRESVKFCTYSFSVMQVFTEQHSDRDGKADAGDRAKSYGQRSKEDQKGKCHLLQPPSIGLVGAPGDLQLRGLDIGFHAHFADRGRVVSRSRKHRTFRAVTRGTTSRRIPLSWAARKTAQALVQEKSTRLERVQ